jgi:hypothetical protein
MRKTVTKSAFVLLALMLAYETQALVPYEPKPPAKKKMEKDYEQKLFKWDSEAVLGLLTARLRILSFFAREEP